MKGHSFKSNHLAIVEWGKNNFTRPLYCLAQIITEIFIFYNDDEPECKGVNLLSGELVLLRKVLSSDAHRCLRQLICERSPHYVLKFWVGSKLSSLRSLVMCLAFYQSCRSFYTKVLDQTIERSFM